MNQEELEALKTQLKEGNNDYLKLIFEKHGTYCISNIQRKFSCPLEDAEDLLIDAILNFRDKLLSGKITYITSIKNYLYTTCVNMKLENNYYSGKKKEKEKEVIHFLYDDEGNYREYKEELIKISQDSFMQLGEACQKILSYFYVYNYSMQQIADKMNFANANTAKVSKSRCQKKWLNLVKSIK